MDDQPPPTSKSMRRKARGIQSAARQGFYRRDFTETEISELDASLSAGLMDEIAAIKVVMRRLFEVATEQDDNPEDLANLLLLMSQTGVKLASMLRTQKLLGGSQEQEIHNAVTTALKEVMKGWKIYNAR